MSKPAPLVRGVTYHIYARGTNREDIFIEPRNYAHFLRLYATHVLPIADTYAYCLLKNHFHLLVRIKTLDELQRNPKGLEDPSGLTRQPSQTFSNFLNAYAKAINLAYQRTGSLIQHPFGRIAVNDERYFARLVVYIHRNPQRHGLIADFQEWPHSSYATILSRKPTKLQRADTLAWFGDRGWFERSHHESDDASVIAPLIGEDFD